MIRVVLACPYCNTTSDYHGSPVGACPACGRRLPESLRRVAANAFGRRMPLLIRIGIYIGALRLLVSVLILAMVVIGVGTYSINGEVVSRAEFARTAVPVVVAYGALGGLLAWGYWKEESWARPLTVVAWTGLLLATTIPPSIASGDVSASAQSIVYVAVLAGVVALYFYGKPNVRAYHGSLKHREEARQEAHRAGEQRPNGA